MKRFLRKLVPYLLGALLLAAIVWAFMPQPVAVDLATAATGSLRVVVEEDGKTRIKERFLVSAPVAGQLQRIDLKAGDGVEASKTVLARIEPTDPALLDARAHAEAEARVRSAQATQKQAQAKAETASVEAELGQRDLERAQQLRADRSVAKQEYDTAEHRARMALSVAKAAQCALQVADFDLELAQAALRYSKPGPPDKKAERSTFEIRAPVTGKVLRVFEESAAVVSPGVKLLEVGDPLDLEVVVDVLSRDAVQIRSGNEVILEHWGGNAPLSARVRLVEPAAFLKLSALGVEEQRVNVIADFVDAPEARAALGDAFRVEARIVVWEGAEILKIPAGALFRKREQWSVFVVDGGRARLRPVEVGRTNGLETEIRSGLAAGDQVVIHPSDRIQDGVLIKSR